jgi:hypothetical protein
MIVASSRARAVAAATALGCLAAAGGCVDFALSGETQVIEREEHRFQVQPAPLVTLATFDGSIQIRAWDRSEVEIAVEKRAIDKASAEDIEVRADQDGNHVTVEVRIKPGAVVGGLFNMSRRGARLIVSLPPTARVEARSGDGSIDVEGVAGGVDLQSGDGSIRGRELSGGVVVQTGDGSLRLENVSGPLDARTGDGSIDVDGGFEALRLRTGDGSIRIAAAPGSVARTDWDITTGDGSVLLELPAGFAGEVDARTDDGRITASGIDLTRFDGEDGRRMLRGRLGRGGSTVRIRTGDGSIRLLGTE